MSALHRISPNPVAKTLPLTAIRLRERMDELGDSQEELAHEIGATQGAISQILTGATRNSRLMPKIARSLAVNLDWLMGLTDEKIDMFDDQGEKISEDDLARMRAGQSSKTLRYPEQLQFVRNSTADRRLSSHAQPSEVQSDAVELQEFEVSYGLGSSFIHDEAPVGKTRLFSRSWIRQFTESPFEALFWGRGIGDSMTPTIQDADIVLIDTHQRTPKIWDKLWAVEVGGLGAIKRLRPTRDGTGMRLLSSNADVPEEVVFDDEMTVIGRVVAIVRKV